MKMATRGAPTKLRLYHEVSVAEPAEQWFEYAGCRRADRSSRRQST